MLFSPRASSLRASLEPLARYTSTSRIIQAVCFPRSVLFASLNDGIGVWHPEEGTVHANQEVSGHQPMLHRLPGDGSAVLVAAGRRVGLFEIEQRRYRWISQLGADVSAVAAWGPGGRVLVGAVDGGIELLDAVSGIRLVGGSTFGSCIKFMSPPAPDGHFCVTLAGAGKLVFVLDSTIRPTRVFDCHQVDVSAIAPGPSDGLFASGDISGAWIVWRHRDGLVLHRGVGPGPVTSIKNVDGVDTMMILEHENGDVTFWNTASECPVLPSRRGNVLSPLPDVRLSAHHEQVTWTDDESVFAIRHARSMAGATGARPATGPHPGLLGHDVTEAGDRCVTWSQNTLLYWSLTDDTDGETEPSSHHTGSLSGAAFGPGRCATWTFRGETKVWDFEQCSLDWSFRTELRQSGAAFSPDGKLLATWGKRGEGEGLVLLWDIPSRRLKVVVRGHRSSVLSSSFAPDMSFLASGDAAERVQVRSLQELDAPLFLAGQASLCAFADESTLVGATKGGTLTVWRSPQFATAGQRSLGASVSVLVVARPGLVLVGTWDGELVLTAWEDGKLAELVRVRVSTRRIVAIQAHASRALATDDEGHVAIFDLSGWGLLANSRNLAIPACEAEVSPGGEVLEPAIAYACGSSVRLLSLANGQPIGVIRLGHAVSVVNDLQTGRVLLSARGVHYFSRIGPAWVP